jgi:hypothetical protein
MYASIARLEAVVHLLIIWRGVEIKIQAFGRLEG